MQGQVRVSLEMPLSPASHPSPDPTSLPSLEGPISALSVSTLPLSLLEDWGHQRRF